MRKILILFCLVSIGFCGDSYAQNASFSADQYYRNAVYVELFGNAGIGSVNYERLFRVKEDPIVTLRLGGFVLPDHYGYLLVLPAEISFINGKRNVKFEYGFGMTYMHFFERERPFDGVEIDVERTWVPVFRLGARYQPAGKPFFMRLAFTPQFVGDAAVGPAPILPWAGLSFGYSFGKK